MSTENLDKALDSLMSTFSKSEEEEDKDLLPRKLAVNFPEINSTDRNDPPPSLMLGEKESLVLEFYLLGDVATRIKGSFGSMFNSDSVVTLASDSERRAVYNAIIMAVKDHAKRLVEEFGVENIDRETFVKMAKSPAFSK